jgi:hypothetical protein
MNLGTWHAVTGGVLVLLCICQLGSVLAGATLSRRTQAVNLVSMLLLALEMLLLR